MSAWTASRLPERLTWTSRKAECTTNVTTIYDSFCPVPFLPPTFGFRRIRQTWRSSGLRSTGEVLRLLAEQLLLEEIQARLWPRCELQEEHSGRTWCFPHIYPKNLGQKSCRTKVSRIFRIFLPNFAPKFSRIFRASFRGRRRPEKIHQKSPPFFNAKFPGKHEKNIHKILLESRQSNKNLLRLVLSAGTCTPARKYYIHKFLFSELISRKNKKKGTFQLQENIFWALISRKLHITYSFVIQRITWKNCLGINFGENLISATQKMFSELISH